MMHRDNPEVPVGEFVDVLNEHKRAGRITRLRRLQLVPRPLQEGQQYAKRKGLKGFSAVSNQLQPGGDGGPRVGRCLSAKDADSASVWKRPRLRCCPGPARRAASSPTAPTPTSDEELVRCWYSEDNFTRRERAYELAARKASSRSTSPSPTCCPTLPHLPPHRPPHDLRNRLLPQSPLPQPDCRRGLLARNRPLPQAPPVTAEIPRRRAVAVREGRGERPYWSSPGGGSKMRPTADFPGLPLADKRAWTYRPPLPRM